MYKVIDRCRSCGSTELKKLISFGETALADALLTKERLNEDELKVPLTLAYCSDCSLTQILEEVPPEILFCRDYPYYSSVSNYLMEHFGKSAEDIISARKLTSESFVTEAASNDGYMLRKFVEKNIPVLGIDPAEGPAKKAVEKGVPTLNTFFTQELAKTYFHNEGRYADVFLANNVLAHVPDLNGFVEGIQILLKEDGVAVIEVPYLIDLIDKTEFDTIYHQHLCYFSVTALDKLFRRHKLFLNDVKHVAIHGGTLRLFIEKKEIPGENVRRMLEDEAARKIGTEEFFEEFICGVKEIKESLYSMLTGIKKDGLKIAGYGAAAKSNTLQAYTGINNEMIDYIADLSKFKQGLYFSGTHIPIVSPSLIRETMPDYVVILAWNFADEIMQQLSDYKEKGGKFIVPIPRPKII
ncbi:MAG: methyltransferase domain-containing protein [Syntrophothermus sp.]